MVNNQSRVQIIEGRRKEPLRILVLPLCISQCLASMPMNAIYMLQFQYRGVDKFYNFSRWIVNPKVNLQKSICLKFSLPSFLLQWKQSSPLHFSD